MRHFTNCIILTVLLAGAAAEGSPYVVQGPFALPFPHEPDAPMYPGPTGTPSNEFSVFPDRNTTPAADPGQLLLLDGAGGVAEAAFDVVPQNHATGELDALADHRDQLFEAVVINRAELLFSVTSDPNIYVEETAGGGSLWADAATDIDNMTADADLDGLAVWGVDDVPVRFDVDRYSLPGDPQNVGVYDEDANDVVSNLDLGGAIARLLGRPDLLSELGIALDVDAFMINDARIVFSVAPITVGQPGSQVSLDGGEIFFWDGIALAAEFLNHGGRLWNTAFSVTQTFPVTDENINALETVAGHVPQPSTADFDEDGDVDGDDFLIWQTSFGVDDGGDADGDGDTDGDDFLAWQNQFGSGSGSASAAVPEPASIALLFVFAAVGMFSRRA